MSNRDTFNVIILRNALIEHCGDIRCIVECLERGDTAKAITRLHIAVSKLEAASNQTLDRRLRS